MRSNAERRKHRAEIERAILAERGACAAIAEGVGCATSGMHDPQEAARTAADSIAAMILDRGRLSDYSLRLEAKMHPEYLHAAEKHARWRRGSVRSSARFLEMLEAEAMEAGIRWVKRTIGDPVGS